MRSHWRVSRRVRPPNFYFNGIPVAVRFRIDWSGEADREETTAAIQARNSGGMAWKIVIVVLRSSPIMVIFWRWNDQHLRTVLMWEIRVKRWEMLDSRALARVTRKTMFQCTDVIKASGRVGFRENLLRKSLTARRPFYHFRLGFSQIRSCIHLEHTI